MEKVQSSQKVSEEYESGKHLAERWFTHYLTNGTCNEGSCEAQCYCECVAGIIRDKKPFSPGQIGLVKILKEEGNSPFNEGVCDLLLEKINDYNKH